MLLDPRAILMFGANVLLLHLTLMVDSALAGWSLYLLLLGPMVVFPALYLRHRSYFICTLGSGLWVDAALPAPFGLFTVCFLAVGALIFHMRIRFRAEHNYHPVLIAHALNAVFSLLLLLSEGSGRFGAVEFWIQSGTTWLLSHLVLLIVAPWFFNLQRSLFEICQLEIEPDEYPMV
jgi:hypothetical protein